MRRRPGRPRASSTNTGRPADPRRLYALDMLHCAACGKKLTGDTGYYRHRDVCAPFANARPSHRGRGQSPGHAYRQEMYEQIVEALLVEAYVGAEAVAKVVDEVVDEVARTGNVPDRAASQRITRERERAVARYLRDRDAAGLERTMTHLDGKHVAAESRVATDNVPAGVAVSYLRERPDTWRKSPGRERSTAPGDVALQPHRGPGDPGGDGPPQRARGATRPCGGATGGAANTRKWSGREELRRHV